MNCVGQRRPGLYGHQTSSESRESAKILGRVSDSTLPMSEMLTEHQETIGNSLEVIKLTLSAGPPDPQNLVFLRKICRFRLHTASASKSDSRGGVHGIGVPFM